MYYRELNNQAIKNFIQAIIDIQKSLAAIKKYMLKRCDIILLAKTNSFIKGAIYVT